jgi:predicted ferric reductase
MLKGYRAVALIEIFVCVCFLFNPSTGQTRDWFTVFSYAMTGVMLVGSLLAMIETRRWKLTMLVIITIVLTIVEIILSITSNTFFASGFSLIAFNLLFIVANLHFLGKGLK